MSTATRATTTQRGKLFFLFDLFVVVVIASCVVLVLVADKELEKEKERSDRASE